MAKTIGIFDSGVGGLTVLKQLKKSFPAENFLYLGDTARVPYGTRSKETVIHYAMQDARFLENNNVDIIIVACHTASAYALSHLKKMCNVKVIGVLEAAIREAVKSSNNSSIGIIGTDGTINSDSYQTEIKKLSPNSKVYSKACPLFVPLAEEGWCDDDISKIVAERYLSEFRGKINSLILACTHYPLLKDSIQHVVGNNVTLIDPAEVIASEIIIEKSTSNTDGRLRLCVTDIPMRFMETAERFLGGPLPKIERVEIENIKI